MEINLTAPSQVRQLLREFGVFPKKRLGQNFLIDGNTLSLLIQAMELSKEDLVLEVGSGIGTATIELAKGAEKVIAVEIDSSLIPILEKTLADHPSAKILNQDFLKLNLPAAIQEESKTGKAKVFANLPYYITSPIIAKLVDERQYIDRAVLMVQREVADRLLAKPATPDYSAFTILVRFHMNLSQILQVSRKAFLPAPAVDSAALLMIPRESPAVQVRDEKLFFNVVKAGFGKRRKTLDNALAGHSAINLEKQERHQAFEKAGIDPMRRAETLTLEEFGKLADCIQEVQNR